MSQNFLFDTPPMDHVLIMGLLRCKLKEEKKKTQRCKTRAMREKVGKEAETVYHAREG